MITLTIVRVSNCSHGTVRRTTEFWSGRYGFESQPLRTCFNFMNTMKNRDTTLPLIHRIPRHRKYSERERSPYEIFRCRETKNSRQKIVIYPSYAKNLSIPDIFWNTEGFSTNLFGTVRQKNCRRKIITPSTPNLSIKCFDTRNFLKHRVHLRSSSASVLWDIEFSTENRDKVWKYFLAWSIEISGGIDVCRKLDSKQ